MKTYIEWRTVETPSGILVTMTATWESTRLYRNLRLQESDIMVTRFAEAGLPVSEEWRVYRQQLRDITTAYATPEDVVFPDAPPFVISDTAVSQEERLEAAELMIDLLLDTQQETPVNG
jgi:hypothetical protein